MHLIKAAAYAAIFTIASAACPSMANRGCAPLQKRSIVDLDNGQLTSGLGKALEEISNGQIISSGKSHVQQAPDGGTTAAKTKKQEENQDLATTVINAASETILFEPATLFITATGSNNGTNNETNAGLLPPFVNTTKASGNAKITSDNKVIPITVAPFANTTTISQTTLIPLITPGPQARPSNETCPLTGRCPDLTQNRRGYVFGDSIISQHMVAVNNYAPALCDAQDGCVAYQIGPMVPLSTNGYVNSNPGAPRANIQESLASISGFARGSGQESGQGNIAPDAANEGLMMAVVNLLGSIPGDSFDLFATNDDLASSNEFAIYDHVCDVSGTFPNCVTGGGAAPSATTSSGNFSIPATITSEVFASTLKMSSIQTSTQSEATETFSSAFSSAESIVSILSSSTQQSPMSSLSSSPTLSPSPSPSSSSSSLSQTARSSTVISQDTSATTSQLSPSSTASQYSSTGSTLQTTSSGSELHSSTTESLVSFSTSTSAVSLTSSILISTSSTISSSLSSSAISSSFEGSSSLSSSTTQSSSSSSSSSSTTTPSYTTQDSSSTVSSSSASASATCDIIQGCYFFQYTLVEYRGDNATRCAGFCQAEMSCLSYVLSSAGQFCSLLSVRARDAFDQATTSAAQFFCNQYTIFDRSCITATSGADEVVSSSGASTSVAANTASS